MGKKISVIGIIAVVLYFISMSAFLVTKSEDALTVWELMTVISAPVVLLVLLEISHYLAIPVFFSRALLVFMAGVCTLTGAAHIVNITVTRRLIREGIDVPLYFQIGQWPSVEMAVDYLAWGFFMGLAFLCIGISAAADDRPKRRIRTVSMINGILCIIGFAGALFINENLWYAAPIGYGFGLGILCILRFKSTGFDASDSCR